MTEQKNITSDLECASDGTLLRDPRRTPPQYSLPKAYYHFRELLKDKEETSHVFKIFESLPSKSYIPRVRALALSERGEELRAKEPFLPPILDDHDALRELPKGSVAHAYCDFMEREGLSAAGLVEEADKLGNPKYGDLVEWFGFRSRDTHDLMHVLTGYGRDGLGEQCVLLFTHGQSPSHGHLLIGYAGAVNIKKTVKSRAPVFRACRQAQQDRQGVPAPGRDVDPRTAGDGSGRSAQAAEHSRPALVPRMPSHLACGRDRSLRSPRTEERRANSCRLSGYSQLAI